MGRIVMGIALVAAAALLVYVQYGRTAGQSDRDIAACSGPSATECVLQQRPIDISWTQPFGGGRREYEVAVELGPHSFFSFYGLTEADVAQLHGVTTMPVVYRADRAVAIVMPDGSPVAVPFAFAKAMLRVGLLAAAIALLGLVCAVSGVVRAARMTPAY